MLTKKEQLRGELMSIFCDAVLEVIPEPKRSILVVERRHLERQLKEIDEQEDRDFEIELGGHMC